MRTGMDEPYRQLTQKSLEKGGIGDDAIRWILSGEDVALLPLLEAAYQVRYAFFQNKVKIHILNNVQSGGCTENCKYCAQSGEAGNIEAAYPMQGRDDILAAARKAHEAGAFRHCMVFSGRRLGADRIGRICEVVQEIKRRYPMEVCISAGFLNPADARRLADAGVNRYNHNLNTSRRFYGEICTSHDYHSRLATIETARGSGLDVCSGVIIGMGEGTDDIISMTRALNQVGAASIPVNFFIPVPGHRLSAYTTPSPHYCLKILAVFRFTNPRAEIRAAAGREYHLRSQQALCLYPANSIFAKGYLTTGGDDIDTVKQMITDSGFEVDIR